MQPLLLLLALVALVSGTSAFSAPGMLGAPATTRASTLTMGPAKDGPFTPIVLAAKVVLGEPRLQKVHRAQPGRERRTAPVRL